ncbi:hypothetical protein EJ110_NYTH14927 [Nymphaea thermarum]|nr:hypothetical protein EJ110_NYTH14927 [Nymphaea thermarum]
MLHDLRQKRIQKEIDQADVGYNERLEDEEEEAYECDDEDDNNLRIDLDTSRANSFQFQAMADAIASIGPGFKMPSYHHVVKQRTPLRQMFASEEWAAYPHAHKRNASIVVDIVFINVFWESCVKLLKVCVPLVKVLRLADSEDRPSIGYLYEAMDKAKEAIRDNLKEKKKLYMPIWKIIDKRWTGQLHQPFYAAAYYLNPAIRFFPTYKKDREVMHGLLYCINVLVEDSTKQDAVHNELDLYDSCFRNMGLPAAVRARTTMRPDLECFNLEAEATEGFVDEGESATAGAGAEYVGGDLPILDEEDEDEDDKDYE